MRRHKTRLGSLLLCCCVAWSPLASIAATDGSTVEALLAEEDAALVKGVLAWNKAAFALPDDMKLDPSLRDSVTSLVSEHMRRMQTLIPAWIADERTAAKNPTLRSAALAEALYRRSINEMAIGFVESVGPAHDEALLKAAIAPYGCRWLPPTHFARRIALIQAAPIEVRPALLAAEKELLSRWGTVRQRLRPRPSAAELSAADRAITRVREGLPVTVEPMTPFLAEDVFSRNHRPDKPNRWEQCARSQWWLQSQLADGHIDRAQALTIYRYSTLPDVSDLVPPSPEPTSKSTGQPEGKPSYPPAARYFQVEGSTTLKVNVDDQGKAFKAEVVARQIRVPGVRDNRPVAFEGLLDDAAVEFARQRSYSVGDSGEKQFVMNWTLKEGGQ